MTLTIEELRRQMEEAAGREDYEEAGRLRDRISLLRAAGKTVDDGSFDPAVSRGSSPEPWA